MCARWLSQCLAQPPHYESEPMQCESVYFYCACCTLTPCKVANCGDPPELMDMYLKSHCNVLRLSQEINTRLSAQTLTAYLSWPKIAIPCPTPAIQHQCSYCRASQARSAKRTSNVSCKEAILSQQLPQLDRPADPAQCLPRRNTTAGSLPAQINSSAYACGKFQQTVHELALSQWAQRSPAHARWNEALLEETALGQCHQTVPQAA